MKREEILKRLGFTVPDGKKKRVIIHSDIAAEADDQFAIVHHLLTPSEDVVGIIAANFEWRFRTREKLAAYRFQSLQKSYEEGQKILRLMDIDDVPLLKGAIDYISDRNSLPESEGADFIIKEAMKESDRPLYIALQGGLTDLAIAYLKEPEIANKIEAAIWIGGGNYPEGGRETNLQQDIYAAQVVFSSPIKIWQFPLNSYANFFVTFAELISKVKPCGAIGNYLWENMAGVNEWYGKYAPSSLFPHGEAWSLGDSHTVAVLLQTGGSGNYEEIFAPDIEDDMTYKVSDGGKKIRVYKQTDKRAAMEDFFAKLKLCYGINFN